MALLRISMPNTRSIQLGPGKCGCRPRKLAGEPTFLEAEEVLKIAEMLIKSNAVDIIVIDLGCGPGAPS